jgi:hypothetical protein
MRSSCENLHCEVGLMDRGVDLAAVRGLGENEHS